MNQEHGRVVLCTECRGRGCHYFHARGHSWQEDCRRCEGHGCVHALPSITASDFAPPKPFERKS